MHRYSAFGLAIESDIEIPELIPGPTESDVVVRRGRLAHPSGLEPGAGPAVSAHQGGILLSWAEVGSVLVRQGSEIVVDAIPLCDDRLIRHIILGVSMGVLLHQRGLMTVHASAVSINGAVAAFLGVKGAGKSTLAAALHGRGHPLVTDDLLVLDVRQDDPRVSTVAGVPQLKLWPEALQASLGESAEDLPRLYAPSPKRIRAASPPSPEEALDLRAVFVLDRSPEGGPTTHLARATAQEAFVALIQHAYPLRFLGKDAVSAEHLRQCTHVATHVPMYVLRRRPGLDLLDDVVGRVEEALDGPKRSGSPEDA